MRRIVALVALVGCKFHGDGSDRQEPRPPEIEASLGAVERGARAYHADHASFPVGTAGPTPADSCCDSGRADRRCEPVAADWDQGIWRELGFAIDQPHDFRYTYRSDDGKSFRVEATGDLDCDGAAVVHVLEGDASGGEPSFNLMRSVDQD